jgi:hypothetical protein
MGPEPGRVGESCGLLVMAIPHGSNRRADHPEHGDVADSRRSRHNFKKVRHPVIVGRDAVLLQNDARISPVIGSVQAHMQQDLPARHAGGTSRFQRASPVVLACERRQVSPKLKRGFFRWPAITLSRVLHVRRASCDRRDARIDDSAAPDGGIQIERNLEIPPSRSYGCRFRQGGKRHEHSQQGTFSGETPAWPVRPRCAGGIPMLRVLRGGNALRPRHDSSAARTLAPAVLAHSLLRPGADGAGRATLRG